MIVHTAHVRTESSDHYIWVYADRPTHEQVVRRLWEMEQAEDFSWYMDTTSVNIETTKVIE